MNINELEELAKAATPGPWKFGIIKYKDDTHQPYFDEKPFNYTGSGYSDNPAIFGADNVDIVGCDEYYIFNGPADVAYLVTANPSAILELIAAYREAVAEIHTCAIDEYFDGHGSLQGGAINTAKRLGVE